MAFQTNFLVDGVWTTRTIDYAVALRLQDERDKMDEMELNAPLNYQSVPTWGVLTQTVIPSPVIRQVLPVRLRRIFHNEVAFIGVRDIARFLSEVTMQLEAPEKGSRKSSQLL